MSEEMLWDTWKQRWIITNRNAEDTVKEIFRLGGTRPVEKKKIESIAIHAGHPSNSLDFAIELGWLNDCLNETYRVTSVGLLMLSHRIKD